MNDCILAVDVGNSRVKFGVFRPDGSGVIPIELAACSLRHHQDVADQLSSWAEGRDVGRSIMAGSNPPIRERLASEWPSSLPAPEIIHAPQTVPVRLAVDQPEAIGIDRVLNAWAAVRLCPDQDIIVVDAGTATTIDLVTSDAVFRGGSILPGLWLSAYALHNYTARLPLIDVDAQLPELPRLPGANTDEAIRSGLYWGQLGAIREIVGRLCEMCEEATSQLILTGGGSRQLMPHFESGLWIDSLALCGLAFLAADAAE